MRTTVNLPEDLHQRIMSVAKDMNKTMSEAFVEILRRGLGGPTSKLAITVDDATGLPQIELGAVVTTDDVRAVLDED